MHFYILQEILYLWDDIPKIQAKIQYILYICDGPYLFMVHIHLH